MRAAVDRQLGDRRSRCRRSGPARTSSSVPSGWARRTVTPGCWPRNAPTSGVTGSTARVGRATRSRWPATTPPTASTSARSVSRARSASRAARHERLAGGGQDGAPADAVEQLDAELALEGADGVGERRLGDEAGLRRGGEGAVVDDGEGVAQLVQLHRESLWNQKKIGLGRIARSRGPVEVCTGSPSSSSAPLVGYLGGMFGKGGSAIATPLLAAVGVPAIVAVASPLPATVPGTLVAYRRYRHLGLVGPVRDPQEPGGRHPGDGRSARGPPAGSTAGRSSSSPTSSSPSSACASCVRRATPEVVRRRP